MRLEGLIPFLAGVYFLLALFRVVNVSKNPQANEAWLQKFGTLIKICAPILILFGAALLLGVLGG